MIFANGLSYNREKRLAKRKKVVLEHDGF